MKKPHKHAAIIKAWADGARIQYATPKPASAADPSGPCIKESDWIDCDPSHMIGWDPNVAYRVAPMLLYRVALISGQGGRITPHLVFTEDAERAVQMSMVFLDWACPWREVPGTGFNAPASGANQPPAKPKPHRWQREMDAHAAGKTIECRAVLGPCGVSPGLPTTEWAVVAHPAWLDVDTIEYRVKPEAAAMEFVAQSVFLEPSVGYRPGSCR